MKSHSVNGTGIGLAGLSPPVAIFSSFFGGQRTFWIKCQPDTAFYFSESKLSHAEDDKGVLDTFRFASANFLTESASTWFISFPNCVAYKTS